MKPAVKTASYRADPVAKVVEVCIYLAIGSMFLLSGLNIDTLNHMMLAVR